MSHFNSNFCFKFVNAPLINAVEELDGVEQSHLVPLDPPLVLVALAVVPVVVELLYLGVEPQPLDVFTAPITELLTSENSEAI